MQIINPDNIKQIDKIIKDLKGEKYIVSPFMFENFINLFDIIRINNLHNLPFYLPYGINIHFISTRMPNTTF